MARRSSSTHVDCMPIARTPSRLLGVGSLGGALFVAASLALLPHCSSDPVSAAAPDASAADVAVDAPNKVAQLCEAFRAGQLYPPEPHRVELLETIPDLSFAREGGTLLLRQLYDPCASSPKVLILRVSAGFCGPCQWSLAHTQELTKNPRLQLVDVMVSNEWNFPARVEDLTRLRAKVAASGAVTDANLGPVIDPDHRLAKVDAEAAVLPLFVFVDTRTMQIVNVDANPSHEAVIDRAEAEIARMDGKAPAAPKPEPKIDGFFSRNQWDMLQDMALDRVVLPPDPTNAYADDALAATFGKRLFFDATLSPSGSVSCAGCHDPNQQFHDGRPTSMGVALGDRNAPSVLFSAHSPFQFWDGRADSLWMQAVGPFENDLEFASSRLFVAHRIFDAHRAEYEAVFGAKYPLPPLGDGARFPAAGKPGQPAYDAMARADQDAVTRVLVNVGKAIAAFERSLRVKPNAFDAYLGGQKDAIALADKNALRTWFNAGCIQCHWGPLLTDNAFHNIRFPTGRRDGRPDVGAQEGLQQLLASPFNANGPYSDAPSARDHRGITADVLARMRGAFRTPALRGAAAGGPWGHGGTFTDLTKVMLHYGSRAEEVPMTQAVGTLEPWLPRFDDHAQTSLAGVFDVLTAEPLPR